MVIILLAAYNEFHDIGHLLEKFSTLDFRFPFKIVVVDDGSNDNTSEAVLSFTGRLPIHLLKHETNKGLTESLRTGFEHIGQSLQPNDLVITMDADNSHDPQDIYKILEKFNAGYDIISGSRFCPGGKMIGVPAYRMFLSNACRFILSNTLAIKGISDYSGLYRGYRGNLIQKALQHT